MSFRTKLKSVVDHVEGALGCILIDLEGMEIDWFPRDGTEGNLRMIAVELSSLLKKLRMMSVESQDDILEVSMTAGSVTTLARVVSDEYMLVVSLRRDADVSRAQSMLRLVAPFVEREIS